MVTEAWPAAARPAETAERLRHRRGLPGRMAAYPLWPLVLTVYSAEPAVREAGRRKTGRPRLARTCGGKPSGGAPGRPSAAAGCGRACDSQRSAETTSAKAQASQRPLRSRKCLA